MSNLGVVSTMSQVSSSPSPVRPVSSIPPAPRGEKGVGPPAPAAVQHEMHIRPRPGWIAIDWAELLRFHELLYFLTWRDVKVRYKQTALGFTWAIIQPLTNALIAFVIFGLAANLGRDLPPGTPYLVFAFVGQLPWQFFSGAMTMGGTSLINSQNLLTKVYFPRLFIPTSAVGGLLFDLFVSIGVLGVFLIVYHFVPLHHPDGTTTTFTPSWELVFLPLLILPATIASLGMAYTLSAATVSYRDIRLIIPFITPIWMQASFVQIPREIISKHWWYVYIRWPLSLNPMYGIIQGFRHCVLGMDWSVAEFVVSTLSGCAIFVFGMFYFRRTERRFADIA